MFCAVDFGLLKGIFGGRKWNYIARFGQGVLVDGYMFVDLGWISNPVLIHVGSIWDDSWIVFG